MASIKNLNRLCSESNKSALCRPPDDVSFGSLAGADACGVNYCESLVLQLFDSGPEAISGAATEKIPAATLFGAGSNAGGVKRTDQKIGSAFECLNSPNAKPSYDERLRDQLENPELLEVDRFGLIAGFATMPPEVVEHRGCSGTSKPLISLQLTVPDYENFELTNQSERVGTAWLARGITLVASLILMPIRSMLKNLHHLWPAEIARSGDQQTPDRSDCVKSQ